ncbi:MAG: methyl-accepting chemotaxis protein [Blautia sp.]|nr:methyl-accepting chemotaxis protein [Blautia sp.]MCM1200214.1 methyl-accepting chemotaxis protein [Bacteroides fragilis]
MEKEKSKGLLKKGAGKKEGDFVSIEKKISSRFAQTILICCVVLGVVTSVLSYISSISAVSETINNTSDVAANYVAAALEQYVAIAYETGSIARLADPERSAEDKAAILEQRISDHNFDGGFILDSNGIDVITGTDLSNRDYFHEAMKGNTYVSTPAYSDVTKAVSYAVAAPLWEGGIPGTTPIGAIVYIPDGEFLNDIMRSIKVGEGGTAFMLDASGITIADIDSTLVGVEDSIALGDSNPKLKKYSEICKKMVAGENGTGTYSYGGVTKVVAYSPIPGLNGWSIGVAAVRNEFLGMFFLSLVITVIFVIAFTIFGVRSGIRLGKNVVKPITAVVKRLELLAAGDLHSDTPIPDSNDETATLMYSLAETIQDLKVVISDIDNHLAELSDGNFLISIDGEFKGDFAQISESFKGIIHSLSSAMRDIDGNAQSVQKGAMDLAGAAQTLAEGATDQASAIEELTATITDISEKIYINAQNAEKARGIVANMNDQIIESNEHMKKNTEAMDKIREASDKIAEIISSIEEIADQTTLLALNASIEAARAGENGRGFAVVATQVGVLADQSSEAARNTKDLIQNAITAVEEGMQLANSTAESLLAVVDNAKTVNDSITEIAEASDNQATAAAQITEGINQIAGVVESNSATSQESAAASEELSSQADMLKELVGRFRYES